MKQNFDEALKYLLVSEGSFVNNAKDPGGMTNLGVTKTVWEGWTGHDATESDMRNLSTAGVTPLYRKKYWNVVQGDNLPAGIDYCVFDTAVNSGPGRAIKLLQRAIGVTEDGAIGPNTLAALLLFDVDGLIDKYCSERKAFLQSLPTFEDFGNGWTNRVAFVKNNAKGMK